MIAEASIEKDQIIWGIKTGRPRRLIVDVVVRWPGDPIMVYGRAIDPITSRVMNDQSEAAPPALVFRTAEEAWIGVAKVVEREVDRWREELKEADHSASIEIRRELGYLQAQYNLAADMAEQERNGD